METVGAQKQNQEEVVVVMERSVWEGRRVGRQRALRMRGALEREREGERAEDEGGGYSLSEVFTHVDTVAANGGQE